MNLQIYKIAKRQPGSIAHSVACLTADAVVASSNLSHITFIEINREIISTVILPLPMIHEGQLSVTGKRMCSSTG